MVNYTGKALRGAFISYVFLSLTSLMVILFRMLLSRELSLADFGLFYSVLAFVGMFTFLRDVGLSEAQVKFIPRFIHQRLVGRMKGLVYLVLGVQIFSGSFFLLLFILFAPMLSATYFQSSAARDIIILLGLSFLLEGIIESISMAFNATQRIFYQTSMDFVRALLILVISFFLLRTGGGVDAPARAYVFASIVVAVFYFLLLRWGVFSFFSRKKTQLKRSHIREYLSYSLPLVPASGAIDFLFSKMTIALLTLFSSLEQVALYSASLAVSKLIRHIYDPVRNIVFPISSELWETGKIQRLEDGMALLYKYALIVTLPLAGILVTYPKELLRILFSEPFVEGAFVLQLLAPTMVILTYTTMIEALFMGIGESARATKQILVGGVINVLAGIYLMSQYGMVGAAITLFLAIVARMIYGMFYLQGTIRIRAPWSVWMRTLIASGFFIGVIFILKTTLELWVWLEAAACVAAATVVYLALLLLMRIVSIQELQKIASRVLPERFSPWRSSRLD